MNLHTNDYSQKFYYYPFAVKLDRCVWTCNTLIGLSNKACVSNKSGLHLIMLKMIICINE